MDVDDKVINKLFWWMKNQYGSGWVLLFGTADQIDAGKALWMKKLKRFNAHDIAKTLGKVRKIHPRKPPDIDQFVLLLKHLKGPRLGHLSDKLWISPKMERTNNTGFREKIKEEFGV